MADEPVAHFAGHFGHHLANAGKEDLGHTKARQIGTVRCEERGHQRVRVEIATERQGSAVLPRVPDGPNGQDHLAHTRGRMAPFLAEPLGDVRLDLAAEAEHEAALGVRLEVPTDVGQRHRVAGECHRNRGADLQRLGVFRCEQQRKERIVARLRSPRTGVTSVLEFLRLCASALQVRANATVNLHLPLQPVTCRC